jgi:hypothetical protein
MSDGFRRCVNVSQQRLDRCRTKCGQAKAFASEGEKTSARGHAPTLDI